MPGSLATIVRRHALSVSQASNMLMPSCSSPMSSPIAPEKKERQFSAPCFGAFLDFRSGTSFFFVRRSFLSKDSKVSSFIIHESPIFWPARRPSLKSFLTYWAEHPKVSAVSITLSNIVWLFRLRNTANIPFSPQTAKKTPSGREFLSRYVRPVPDGESHEPVRRTGYFTVSGFLRLSRGRKGHNGGLLTVSLPGYLFESHCFASFDAGGKTCFQWRVLWRGNGSQGHGKTLLSLSRRG